MSILKSIFEELLGLFVDDGSLALGILAWIVVFGVIVAPHFEGRTTGGLLLLAGCLAILAENTIRSARRR